MNQFWSYCEWHDQLPDHIRLPWVFLLAFMLCSPIVFAKYVDEPFIKTVLITASLTANATFIICFAYWEEILKPKRDG